MACGICGRQPVWHGSEVARPGTHLNETGCHGGVMMDDDEHAEGWQADVVYPPCRSNPRRCMTCDGSGAAGPDVTWQDECPDCDGIGWANGKAEYPPAAVPLSTKVLARMRKAVLRGTGVRISAEELQALSVETLGQWMASAAEEVKPLPSPTVTAEGN